ncbi:hypothetical protein J6590_093756 [Homalodisca vitripennis]|nr:hypothetical protein J6590_093756 [Homalodisca vitripennis]
MKTDRGDAKLMYPGTPGADRGAGVAMLLLRQRRVSTSRQTYNDLDLNLRVAPKDWGASRFYKPDDPRYWCPPEPGWDQRSVGLDTTNSKQLKLSSYWMIKESRGGLDRPDDHGFSEASQVQQSWVG